jgi:hypothetical protein
MAFEMYAEKHDKQYPESFAAIIPGFVTPAVLECSHKNTERRNERVWIALVVGIALSGSVGLALGVAKEGKLRYAALLGTGVVAPVLALALLLPTRRAVAENDFELTPRAPGQMPKVVCKYHQHRVLGPDGSVLYVDDLGMAK